MRTIAFNVFVVLLLLSLDLGVVSGSSCDTETNGCSIPGGLPFIYKKTFTPACNKHDICYSCVRNHEKYSIAKLIKQITMNRINKQFHDDVILLQQPESSSFFLPYLSFGNPSEV